MKTITLKIPYILRFNFDKTILSNPVEKRYYIHGVACTFDKSITPIAIPGLAVHHSFISAN